MARFIPSNAMAGVGNIERLALMKQQAAIEEAQKPTVMDRLTKVGGELINYVADKAQYEFKAKQIQAQAQTQAEAQRKEKVLDMKLKQGMTLSDQDFTDLGITVEEGRAWEENKKKLAEQKYANNQLSVKKLVANPTTGMMDVFDTRTGETFAGKTPISEATKAQKEPKVYPVKDMMGNTTFYILNPQKPTELMELVQKQAQAGSETGGTPPTPIDPTQPATFVDDGITWTWNPQLNKWTK